MANPKIKSWIPTSDEEQAFRSTDSTFEWLCKIPTEDLRRYGGKWVAAKNSQIIASGDSLDALLDELGSADLSSLIIDRIEKAAWVVYR